MPAGVERDRGAGSGSRLHGQGELRQQRPTAIPGVRCARRREAWPRTLDQRGERVAILLARPLSTADPLGLRAENDLAVVIGGERDREVKTVGVTYLMRLADPSKLIA